MKRNNLSTAVNSEIDDMDGINKTSFYLGTRGSFTEMHVEDGNAASINVVHFNVSEDQSQPAKVWLIVPGSSTAVYLFN